MKYVLFSLLTFAASFSGISSNAWASTSLLERLAGGGHIALIRHALAPGTGDPAAFDLTDCATQRNLDDAGRAQAREIGLRLREAGIVDADVFSSQWCRCVETAGLLGIGATTELPIINSFFQQFEKRDIQTQQLKGWIARQALSKPTVLVTHQVNITALTGVFPSSGEMVVLSRDGNGALSVVGKALLAQP